MSREQGLRRLVNGEANTRLGAQVALLCSSDARATGLLSGAATIAGIALAAGIAVSNSPALASACFSMALLAWLSSLAALWAIWPSTIDLPGWKPASFESDWEKTEEQVLEEMLPFVHDKIEDNDAVILDLYRRSLVAMILLAASPLGGLAGWAVWTGLAGRVFALFFGGILVAVLFLTIVPSRFREPA